MPRQYHALELAGRTCEAIRQVHWRDNGEGRLRYIQRRVRAAHRHDRHPIHVVRDAWDAGERTKRVRALQAICVPFWIGDLRLVKGQKYSQGGMGHFVVYPTGPLLRLNSTAIIHCRGLLVSGRKRTFKRSKTWKKAKRSCLLLPVDWYRGCCSKGCDNISDGVEEAMLRVEERNAG